MTKIISMILFSTLLLSQVTIAKESMINHGLKNNDTYEETDFNFEENSYNISDEQLKDLENMDKIEDEEVGFWKKIINSSHFSSNTATRTWIPINRQK